MAEEKLEILREADLTNNCPECFNQNLKLTVYQKHVYGKLVHKITNDISKTLICKTCSSNIYPVSWTDDIERSVNYYSKMAVPLKKSTKYTSLFYILLIVLLAIIGAGVYLYVYKPIEF